VTLNSNTLSITVVIPAYNEEANIVRLTRQVLAEPWDKTFILDKLLIVDDCSDDGTQEITRQLASEDDRVHVIRHIQRSGKNSCIRDGIAACSSDVITILDADITLGTGCVIRTLGLLVDNPSLMAASCVNEPLPAKTWRERASRFQAQLLAETSRIGGRSLLRVYAIRICAIHDLALPDTTHDDLYIPRWLHNRGYRYKVQPQAIAYMRSATGLRDFAKQTLRAWRAIEALEQVLPTTQVYERGHGVTLRAIGRAVWREPLGFALYALWRVIIVLTPARFWLPVVDHTRHNTSRSTKAL